MEKIFTQFIYGNVENLIVSIKGKARFGSFHRFFNRSVNNNGGLTW